MAPKSCQSRGEGEIFLQCLENREEKGNRFKNIIKREEKEYFCLKILKFEKRKKILFQNLINREKKENFS